MRDIQTAYPKLLKRIGDSLCAAFGISQSMPHGREVISARAPRLATTLTEPKLKAFALRLADTKLDQTAWIESIGNLLARKSPERWNDQDETEFSHQLESISGRFKRTEFALIGTTKMLNGNACRIALTCSNGTEVGDLVDWNGIDESRLDEARNEIDSVLDRLGPHGLAATMEALWHRFDKKSSLDE